MMHFHMTPGSCSTAIHILLEELDLTFAAHIVNLPAGGAQTPEFLKLNPKGTIPVLVREDGSVLTEVPAIAWWLGAAHPKAGLLPDTTADQAEALEIMTHVVGTVHMQGYTRIFTPERYMIREEDREAVIAQGRHLVHKHLHILARRLEAGGGGPLFGRFTVADAVLFYVEFWADRIALPLPEPCREHFARMLTRPKVRQVLLEEGYRP